MRGEFAGDWARCNVVRKFEKVNNFFLRCLCAGENTVSAMAAVCVAHESAGQEDHEEDHSHEQSYEGAGAAGEEQQEFTGERFRHRRRFSPWEQRR